MKKINKKGFTLIELLAVIVILAVIMVIAVPQILDVISNSKKSAWDSNVKLIDEAITLNTSLGSTPYAEFSLNETLCPAAAKDITSEIKGIADISTSDTKVTCTTTIATGSKCKTEKNTYKYEVVVSPADDTGTTKSQFKGQESQTLCY